MTATRWTVVVTAKSKPRQLSLVRIASAMLVVAMTAGSAVPARANEPLPAGGLSFALPPGVTIESADIRVGLTKITHSYRIRNAGKTARSVLVTFAVPEIDRFSLADHGGFAAVREPINIVGASSTVDGRPAMLRAQQRAYALGLDVTAALTQARLALLPIDPQIDAQIAALAPDVVLDFIERGILQVEDGRPQPGWSLQTMGHWRQLVAASSTATIEHTYEPIIGTQPLSEQAITRAIDRGCMAPPAADAIRRRMSDPNPPQMTTVILQTTAVAGQDPAAQMRVQIDVPDGAIVAATCLEPVSRPDARTIVWSQRATPLDQDVTVVVVK